MTTPGWYPHPDEPGRRVYWDGSGWGDEGPKFTEEQIDEQRRRNRTRGWLIAVPLVLLAAVLSVVVVYEGHQSDDATRASIDTPSLSASDLASLNPMIVYSLTGTATTADITIQTGSGGQSQQQGVDIPLTNQNGTQGLTFTASIGQFLYISAQNKGDGTLTCTITSDGIVVATNTSSGEYAIVTCEGDAS